MLATRISKLSVVSVLSIIAKGMKICVIISPNSDVVEVQVAK
jgi:hypothetical protein